MPQINVEQNALETRGEIVLMNSYGGRRLLTEGRLKLSKTR